MKTENSNIQNSEELVDKLQLLGMIKGPQQYFVQFFTANAGITTSLGDLVDKIDKGTATRNDYIDVIKDIAAIGISTAGLVTLATGATLSKGVIGIGIGLAVLDYIDSRDYDYEKVLDDVIAIKNYISDTLNEITNTQQKKYETWQSLTPEEQAYWISAGGTPWNYNTNTLLDELNNKDLNIIDKIKELLKQASTISSPLVLDINKDGTINTTGKIVNFDLDNNGYAELTAWVNSEDGILVYDKNNNGIIDNGSELFGNNTTLSSGKLAL